MNFFDRLKSLFSARGKALAVCRRGMEKADKGDFAGAIIDYTTTINLPDVALDVKAMALYNRALAHSSEENHDQALADLNAVVIMPQAPQSVKAAAQDRLGRLKRRSSKESE